MSLKSHVYLFFASVLLILGCEKSFIDKPASTKSSNKQETEQIEEGPAKKVSPNKYASAEDLIKRADRGLWRKVQNLKKEEGYRLKDDPDVHIQKGFFRPKCLENDVVSPPCCLAGSYCYVIITAEELGRSDSDKNLAVLGHPYKKPEMVEGKLDGESFHIDQ